MYLTLISEARFVMEVVGDVTLIFFFIIVFLVLKDCLYVFESRKNLILISSLCKLNYSFFFFLKKKGFLLS